MARVRASLCFVTNLKGVLASISFITKLNMSHGFIRFRLRTKKGVLILLGFVAKLKKKDHRFIRFRHKTRKRCLSFIEFRVEGQTLIVFPIEALEKWR